MELTDRMLMIFGALDEARSRLLEARCGVAFQPRGERAREQIGEAIALARRALAALQAEAAATP